MIITLCLWAMAKDQLNDGASFFLGLGVVGISFWTAYVNAIFWKLPEKWNAMMAEAAAQANAGAMPAVGSSPVPPAPPIPPVLGMPPVPPALQTPAAVVDEALQHRSVAEELSKLVALRDRGALTESEFDDQKKRLLA